MGRTRRAPPSYPNTVAGRAGVDGKRRPPASPGAARCDATGHGRMRRVFVEPRLRNDAYADVRQMEPIFDTKARLQERARMARPLPHPDKACTSLLALGPFGFTAAVPPSRPTTRQQPPLVPTPAP